MWRINTKDYDFFFLSRCRAFKTDTKMCLCGVSLGKYLSVGAMTMTREYSFNLINKYCLNELLYSALQAMLLPWGCGQPEAVKWQDCRSHHHLNSPVVACESGCVGIRPVWWFSHVPRHLGHSWRKSGTRDGAEQTSLSLVLANVTQQFSL